MPVGGIVKAGRKILGQADQVAKQETGVLDDILDSFPAPKAEQAPEKDMLDDLLDQMDVEEVKQADELDAMIAKFEEQDAEIEAIKKAITIDELDAMLEEIELAPAPDPFPTLDLADPLDVGIAKSNMLNYDDFDGTPLTEAKVSEYLGSEWAVKMNNMLVLDSMNPLQIQEAINYIAKTENSIDPTSGEQVAWNLFTDLLESTPATKVPVEEIDLDKLTIGNHNQNSPFSFDDLLGDKGYTPEWAFDLDDRQQGALAMMSHIRGGFFAELTEVGIRQRYANRPDSIQSYPNLNDFLLMEPMDIASINFYTRSGDEVMNTALRADAVEPGSDVEASIEATIKGLDSIPSWDNRDGMLYRRVNDEKIRELFNEMEIGQEYTEKAFMSTTRTEMLDLDTLKPNVGDFIPEVTFVIKPKINGNGKPIETLSEFESEQEVLFKPRTKFRIAHKEEVPRFPNYDRDGAKSSIIFIEEI